MFAANFMRRTLALTDLVCVSANRSTNINLLTDSAGVVTMAEALENLSFYTKKAFAWADENKMDHSKLLEASLAPDMLGFTKQIQMCTNAAKFVPSRVAGLQVPVWADDEKSLDELLNRLTETIKLLRSTDVKAFEGKETAPVTFKAGRRGEITLTGLSYVQYWGMPNFFFHVVTAYDILRNAGAPVGKWDYLGGGKTELPK